MQTRTESVASLLQDGLFEIPSYQRSYSWSESQLLDLLEDLVYLPDERTHFLGNIILDPRGEPFRTDRGRQFPVYDVVDGQQRLTTAMILLSVAAEKDEIVAETVEADNLLHPVQERPRLLPQDQDREFFRDSLLGDSTLNPETPSQERLQAAAMFYEEALEELPAGVSIRDISERIRYDCRINVVEVSDQSEAASIFESINDRGKPLSSLEKTKSFLMYMDGRSSNRGVLQDRINDRFGSIYSELFAFSTGHDRVGDFDEDSVQRFHWGLYDGYNSDEYFNSLSTLKDRLREKYRRGNLEGVQETIDTYTISLRETASAFAELFHPTHRPEPVRTQLTRLLELGRLANVLPVLLAAQMRYGDSNPQKMAAIIDRCETFVMRLYAVGRYRSDTGRGKLVSLAHQIESNPEMGHRAILDDLESITRGYVDDDRFRRDLSDPGFYDAVSSRDIRYLLYHYGKNLDGEVGEEVHRNLSTILSSEFQVEHILAQNLEPADIPPGLVDEFDEHVDRLGNLTIASADWNRSLGNLPFEDKRVAGPDQQSGYDSSSLRVQQVLTEYDIFDRDAIDQREQRIVEYALGEWSLDRNPETAAPPPLTYRRQVANQIPSAESIPVEQSNHEYLAEVLRDAPRKDWVDTALDVLHDLIGEFNLLSEDPRLVTSTGKGDRIAVSINNRYVQNAVFTGQPRVGLLVDWETAEEGDLLELVDSHSRFDPLSGESEHETPYFLSFERGSESELTSHLREGWLQGVETELERASGSPYRSSHRPLLYKAAVDLDYRNKLLDEAFEWTNDR